MNCQRALDILTGLATNQPAFTADEIEAMLAQELAVEADPRDMATLQWLVPAVQERDVAIAVAFAKRFAY